MATDSIIHQRCEQLVRFFSQAPIKKTFDMKFSYDAQARAIFELARNPTLDHAGGDTHGGVIATLIDNAGWFTAAPHYEHWLATVDLNVKYIEPAHQENLRAIGELVRAGNRLAITTMRVETKSGRLVAIGSGTFTRTSRSIAEMLG